MKKDEKLQYVGTFILPCMENRPVMYRREYKNVRQRIIAEDLLVKNVADFVAAANNLMTEIILMKQSDIELKNVEIGLATIIKNSKKISDIKSCHYFKVTETNRSRKIIKKVIGEKITPAL